MRAEEIATLCVLGFIVLCGIVALVTYLIVNRAESPKSIQRRIENTCATIQNDYFQAVGEIFQETARQRRGSVTPNLNDILDKVNRRC